MRRHCGPDCGSISGANEMHSSPDICGAYIKQKSPNGAQDGFKQATRKVVVKGKFVFLLIKFYNKDFSHHIQCYITFMMNSAALGAGAHSIPQWIQRGISRILQKTQ